jgi:carbonic anhydrase
MQTFPESLLAGYQRFMDERYAHEQRRYRDLAEHGQTPDTMIVACCDSRSAPETVFNASPGELFVLRNVANLVPPFQPDGGQHGTSAAIEFAVQSLKVKNIVVMGHGRCGGIHAALNPSAQPLAQGDFIGKWLGLVEPVAAEVAKQKLMTAGERQTALERISIRHSVRNLRSFPYVSELEKNRELSVFGAWFDISTGELWIMDDEGDFSRPEIEEGKSNPRSD